MSDFIVLGLIPGTQLQITFLAWLLAACAISGVLIFRAGTRAKLFQAWIIAISIMAETQRRQELHY